MLAKVVFVSGKVFHLTAVNHELNNKFIREPYQDKVLVN